MHLVRVGDDLLIGDDGDDENAGVAHNDLISGDDGNDVLIGNQGVDRDYSKDGNDLIVHNERQRERFRCRGPGQDSAINGETVIIVP